MNWTELNEQLPQSDGMYMVQGDYEEQDGEDDFEPGCWTYFGNYDSKKNEFRTLTGDLMTGINRYKAEESSERIVKKISE